MRSGQRGGFKLVQGGCKVPKIPWARSNHSVMIVSPRDFAFTQEVLQKRVEALNVNRRLG